MLEPRLRPESERTLSEPVDLDEPPADGAPLRTTRGLTRPRALAWFGFRSFWGPLYHFVASAIATEDIDARDWMKADEPRDLARRVAAHILGTDAASDHWIADQAFSVAELLGRDLWVDFVADTGDDVSTSEAVARLLVGTYRFVDPDPRGGSSTVVGGRADILLHGGDVAYPVATDSEIHDRFTAPFNRAFRGATDERNRVLIGIPGNHDWYDGLDGFGRLVRRRAGPLPERDEREPRVGRRARWAGEFVKSGQLQKRRTLVLEGYLPVQDASYFALPLAKGLDLWGVDRQLRTIDYRQRQYFRRWRNRHPERRRVVLFPDPVYAHLEPSKTGMGMVRSLHLDVEETSHLCLAGDLHHYERLRMGASLHVTAGGGGAFLHGARLSRRDCKAPEREWPGQRTTAALLRSVPLHVMLGRAGLIPHVALILLFAPLLAIGVWAFSTHAGVFGATAIAAVLIATGVAFASGHQVNLKRITLTLSIAMGLWIACVPLVASAIVQYLLALAGLQYGRWTHAILVLVVAVPAGTFALGTLLAVLSALGLENTQAMTALGHPGFKHFVRMRVRRDGSRVDSWVIGMVDPLASGEKPVLVDSWSWIP
jgi:hypothetical protein